MYSMLLSLSRLKVFRHSKLRLKDAESSAPVYIVFNTNFNDYDKIMKEQIIPGTELKPGEAFEELERSVHAVLETYSNVHRGNGHNSIVSTYLFEQAREIVLEYLGPKKDKYVVIFCSPRREAILRSLIKPERYKRLSSQDIGLPLGIRALAVEKRALPEGTPFETGGGTTRLVSPGWVIWGDEPDKFEAGTPAIINVIAFARALQLTERYGKDAYLNPVAQKLTAAEIVYNDELNNYSGREMLDKLRQTLIGRESIVPTSEGNKPFINLDNAASTPSFLPVWSTVCQTWHQKKETHQEIINEVKSICAEALGAPKAEYDLIFTSNTTEAINLAAESLGRESGPETEPVVVSTILEHTSNDLPWRMVPNISVIRLSVDNEGIIDLNELEKILGEYNQNNQHGKKRIRLVAISGASNVLGICNDLTEIGRIVHRYGAGLFIDGAQLAAHRKVDMERCGIDYLAFSAHKVYAPFGTGVLAVRKGLLKFKPSEMELINTSGEENAVGIAALGKALLLLQRIGMDLIKEEENELTKRALTGLSNVPGLTIYGVKHPESPRLALKGGVIAFTLKGRMAPAVAKELAEKAGIGVRTGCHCAHILVKHLVGVPPSLERFQWLIAKLFPGLKFPGIIRVSFGIENTVGDIDALINALGKIANKSGTLPRTDMKQQMDEFVMSAAKRVYE
jgi:selenocysteine lyase/cysteine desulfurase